MRTNGFYGTIFSDKLKNLNDGLRFFGLDPRDWQVKENSAGLLMIQNLRDPDLKMHGHAYSKGHVWDWQEITLAAI